MWKIPKIWEGGEVWIIGGGYSILDEFEVPMDVRQQVFDKQSSVDVLSPYFSAIYNKHIIGINVAFLLGNWIDMVFFGDSGFYLREKEQLRNFKGIKVTCNPKFNKSMYVKEDIKFVSKNRERTIGITEKLGYVSWNQNSGCAAISLAAQAGAKRVVLLGFDMSLGKDDHQHWHALYNTANRKNPKTLPFNRHTKGMNVIKKDAKRLGIEIINASPRSTITQFKKVSVKQLL